MNQHTGIPIIDQVNALIDEAIDLLPWPARIAAHGLIRSVETLDRLTRGRLGRFILKVA
ncbi:hypothetical protein TPA4_32 [Tsukamurella phage TPA4]|uniref:hypothetical protein n=1 Tax=Tsukamurella phage TPA4 TaxID=1647476 RepID=UPI0007B6564C|nr:hypothetical protein BH784_gp32 [Tsukamurella phage TPA4]AKJ72197.1 hypothetical protein TPA4_32 [Tsukamurella phage TPA4]